jgi:hydrogenase maturation protease
MNSRNARPETPPLLVIGYGNTLRGDDGVGPRVAEAVAALRLPGVRTLICQQLSPEHAEPISRAETVVFVDAAVDSRTEVRWRPLVPNDSSQLMAHAADPRTMLALSRDVFGHTPKAWWLTIPAVNLEFSESLSPTAEQGYAEAVTMIQFLSLSAS